MSELMVGVGEVGLSAIEAKKEVEELGTRSIGMTVPHLEFKTTKLDIKINFLGEIIEIVAGPDVLSVMQAIEKQHKVPMHQHRLFFSTEGMRSTGASICNGEELLPKSTGTTCETLQEMCQLLQQDPTNIHLVIVNKHMSGPK